MRIESRINIYAAASLALVLSAAVSSCNIAEHETKEVKESASQTEDTRVAFTTISDNSAFALSDSTVFPDKNGVFSAQASLLMPSFVSGSDINTLRSAIVQAAFGTQSAESPEKILHDYISSTVNSLGYTASKLDADTVDSASAQGFINIYGNVASMSPRILSYAVTQYFYPPLAANGSTALSYVNYDFVTGRVMALNDIFTPEGIKALPGIIADRAREVCPDAKVTSLPSGGSYYVDYEGRIVFVYQQGEVCYRAAGAVTAAFYPQELSEYMTATGKAFLID